MEFVCPIAWKWNEIHKNLNEFYLKNKDSIKTPPPTPCILGGWIGTTDYGKKLQWDKTLKWAEENKCTHLIPELKEKEKYFVAKIETGPVLEDDPYGFNEDGGNNEK